MKILVAPCAYKGTLSASQLATAIAEGVSSANARVETICAPIADGGDGTIEAIHQAIGGSIERVRVHGPIGQLHEAYWLRLGSLGIAELACASGLALMDANDLRPLEAHTQGLGEVMTDALAKGCEKIVVCVGGSASTDGGAGMLVALGAKLFDGAGATLGLGGGALADLQSCNLSELSQWKSIDVEVAVDVENPLLGPSGAAAVFGPQKGANPAQVAILDQALENYANVLEGVTGREARTLSGSGAAGGTAFGLAAALGARMISGFNWIASILDLEGKIAQCDMVITAEGKLDSQSLSGKAIGGLASMCRRAGKPLYAVPALSETQMHWPSHGIARVVASAANGVATLHDVSKASAELIRSL